MIQAGTVVADPGDADRPALAEQPAAPDDPGARVGRLAHPPRRAGRRQASQSLDKTFERHGRPLRRDGSTPTPGRWSRGRRAEPEAASWCPACTPTPSIVLDEAQRRAGRAGPGDRSQGRHGSRVLVVGSDGNARGADVTLGLEAAGSRRSRQRRCAAGDLVVIGSRAQLKPGTLVIAEAHGARAAWKGRADVPLLHPQPLLHHRRLPDRRGRSG